MRNHISYLSLLLLLPMTACIPAERGPEPYFEGCGEHCTDDDWRFAAGGGHSTISVRGLFTSVRSSDESVIQFLANGTKVEAFTGNAGRAFLELVGSGGDVVRREVVVEEAARLEINRVANEAAPVRVLADTAQIFHVTTRAADGQITRGDGSVRFTLDGSLRYALIPVDGDSIAFEGTIGTGKVTASCPSASVSQDVVVVDQSAITSLTTTVLEPKGDGKVAVLVGAQSADGPIYAGECEWSGMESSMTIESQVRSSIDFLPASLTTFVLNRAGTFTATCTMAGRSTQVTIAR
jgi:hypothetical protein